MECCETIDRLLADDDVPVRYNSKLREWSLVLLDPDLSFEPEANDWRLSRTSQGLVFCPFCRHRFPPSVRGQFFDLLEAQGVDPWHDPIPPEFRDDQWWKERGL
jgi:hypothetical protein